MNFIAFKTGIPLTAKQTVRQYLRAMKNKDYDIAYKYLSQESRARHSYKEFADYLKEGLTEFNHELIWKIYHQNNKIRLGIQILGDPGSWSFDLICNKGKWRIGWNKGVPYFPYPDNTCCGVSE